MAFRISTTPMPCSTKEEKSQLPNKCCVELRIMLLHFYYFPFKAKTTFHTHIHLKSISLVLFWVMIVQVSCRGPRGCQYFHVHFKCATRARKCLKQLQELKTPIQKPCEKKKPIEAAARLIILAVLYICTKSSTIHEKRKLGRLSITIFP